jgi:FkbH-like protein
MRQLSPDHETQLRATEQLQRDLATAGETPSSEMALRIVRAYYLAADYQQAALWVRRVVDGGDGLVTWLGAAGLLTRLEEKGVLSGRPARVALLSTYTSSQFASLLRLAGMAMGLNIDLYEAPFGQLHQEILTESSRLYRFAPDVLVLAVHEGDLDLPGFSSDPATDVAREIDRWAGLASTVSERSGAHVVLHNFATRPEVPLGHLGAKLGGSRHAMTAAINAGLGPAVGPGASIVDCERLSGIFGKHDWFNDKYWLAARQAVALDALPLLARNTAAVIAAALGISKKCLVLDLDNTLWGGVIAEDGLDGIRLGEGVDGEAFTAFQQYILELKRKGVFLAVCSKNDEASARQPFERHPAMLIRISDIACFVANWDPKPQNIQRIADELGIGLDSLVFVDDSPVEREEVRQILPEVDVITLPSNPSGYRRALADYLPFESATFTMEDARRTDLYRARVESTRLRSSAGSLEDFHRSLDMRARIAPFDEASLPRIAQLIGKTNQFNLTTRRHSIGRIREFIADPSCVHFSLRLRDRFTDHGLVGVLIAVRRADWLEIDTWLLSCRVIGRTVEHAMLSHLCRLAEEDGCRNLRGAYIPTEKNRVVRHLYQELGFRLAEDRGGITTWEYHLDEQEPVDSPFISMEAELVGS